jgi:fatty-acid desaturase
LRRPTPQARIVPDQGQEGWHNNHHASPYSAAFGLRWLEFDLGFLFIRLLPALGLAWNVKVPSVEKMALRVAFRVPRRAS